jgi:hypothetical protein
MDIGNPPPGSLRSFLASPLQFSQTVEKQVSSPSFRSLDPLRKYNIILCVIHIVIAIVLIIYFSRIRNSGKEVNYVNLDLFKHAFTLDSSQNFFKVASEKAASIGERGITTLIVTFFAITAGFHLLYALNPGNIYLSAVSRGNNYLRFDIPAEPATSGSGKIGFLYFAIAQE